MKKVIFTLFVAALSFTACTNKQAEQAKQDSIAAAASADSMLNSAIQADTMKMDSMAMDTTKVDSIK